MRTSSGPIGTVERLAIFLDESRNRSVADGKLKLEANADALQLMVNSASSWPDYEDIPAPYRQALHDLLAADDGRFFDGKAPEGAFLSEIIRSAKHAPKSFEGLYAAIKKYGAHSLVAVLSAVSILMSIEGMFRARGEEDASALRTAETFLSSLDRGFARNDLHRVAIALLRFTP